MTRILAILLSLLPLSALAVWSPPVTNQYPWELHTGIPGGIPNRTTIFSTLSPGVSLSTVNSTIANCPSNQVVKFNAGTYTFSGRILMQKSGVTLRGATNASGVPTTIINATSIDSNPAGIDWVPSGGALSSGYTAGSTSIVFSATPSIYFFTGTTMKIQAGGIAGLVYRTKSSLGAGSDGSDLDQRYSSHRVLTVSGNTVTFTPPLPMTLQAAQNPTAFYLNGGGAVGTQMAGVEDIDLRPNGSANNSMEIWGAYGFWVKNVAITNIPQAGVFLVASVNCEVRHSYIHHANGFPNNADGYGIYVHTGTSFTRIEDNIFEKVWLGYYQTYGCAGNVLAFNFHTNMVGSGTTVQFAAIRSNHGACPMQQLYEGNVGEQFHTDAYHGNDIYATLFRNWFHGLSTTGTGNRIMMNISRGSYYYVLAGNILGSSTWSGPGTFLYEMTGEPGYTEQSVMYRIGYPNTFYNGTGSATPPWPLYSGSYPDANVAATLMRHGNYDYKNAAIVNLAGQDTVLPNSLLYSAKPAYFRSLVWPAFDPANPSTSASPLRIPAGYRFINGTDPADAGGTPPTISSPTTATGTNKVAFSYQITADQSPTSWGATPLPNGLSVNTGNGLISGTINIANTTIVTNITIGATNASGGGTATLALTIQALSAPVVVSLTNTATINVAITPHQPTATQYPTSWGATGLPTGLSINGTSGLVTGTPTVSGTIDSTIFATNDAALSGSANLRWVIAANAPVISITPPTQLDFAETAVGQTLDGLFYVTNTTATGTTLTGHVHTAGAPFSIVGSTNLSLTQGTGTNVTVRYSPTAKGTNHSTIIFITNAGTNTVDLGASAYPIATNATMAFTNAFVALPFVVNEAGNYISQPNNSAGTPSSGGRAVYGVNITNTGFYTFTAIVTDTDPSDDSMYFNIDAEPTVPANEWLWTNPRTMQTQVVNQESDGPPYPNPTAHVWPLTAGLHKLIVAGREANAQLRSITISQTAATSAVYYAATDGINGNSGITTNSPWPITKAITNLAPGVRVELMPGTYPPIVIVAAYSGSSGNVATLKSYTKWGASISNAPSYGINFQGTPSWVVLDGIKIANCTNNGVDWQSRDCTIRNCWITGNNGQGINFSNPACSNNVVEFSLIEGNGIPTDNHYHGLYVAGRNSVVRFNVVRNNKDGFGIHAYSGYSTTWMDNIQIYGNLTYGHTNAYGITLWGANDDGGTLPGTNDIVNNTVLDGIQLSYGTVGITNNIIFPAFTDPTRPINRHAVRVPTILADYNLAPLTLVSNGPNDIVTSTVNYVNSTNGLYWLTAGSPATAAGAAGVLPLDFWGNAPWNVTDIGAFAYSANYTNDTRTLDPSGSDPNYWLLLGAPPAAPGTINLRITGRVVMRNGVVIR